MSFDASRFTFDPRKNYSCVVMQQGRVQLDSDWNEWLAELIHRIRAGTLDALGSAVVPMTTPAGFQVSPANASLAIGAGRIYVDGLLAENHARVNYNRQPFYPNPTPLPQSGGPFLIYLDVWEREITFLEDPDLIEKAVGIDTTGRLQTAWQVKWLDVSGVQGVNCSTPDSNLGAAWQNLHLPPGARLTTGVVQSTASGPCCLAPNTGYTGQENQLYRVEILKAGGIGAATFVWSRDNASVATNVRAITQSGIVLTVQSTGKDDVLRFSPNDWVEITDDWLELNGLPGELHQISQVNDAAKTVTLTSAVSAANFPVDSNGNTDPLRHTRLTRWDQSGKVFRSDGATVWVDLNVPGSTGDIPVPPSGTTLILENGITVSFDLAASASSFRTGDNWEFAARTSDGSVEQLNAAPPRGIFHQYERLSVATLSSSGFSVTDCRTFWPPSLLQAMPALHVMAINWVNDDVMAIGTLTQGLQITLDAPPLTASVSASTMIVSIEVPQNASAPIDTLLSAPIEIQGSPSVSGNKITWIPAAGTTFPFQVPAGSRYRVRVRLLGHVIWGQQNNTLAYLDGQAFGTPAIGAGGQNITSLSLPSGTAARASNFESWFWLVPNVPLSFNVSASAPLTVRSEGLTELMNDILLVGTGGTPTPAGAAVPLVNITVTVNTTVTDRLLTLAAPFLQDAVLLIDDPSTLNATPTTTPPTGVGGSGLNFRNGQAPNLILGQFNPSTPNAVTFMNVPIEPPGAGTRTLRITNLRVNATALLSGTTTAGQVMAVVSLAGSISVPLNNPTVALGSPHASLAAAVISTLPAGGVFTINAATGVNTALAANPAATGSIGVLLQFAGSVPGTFRPRVVQQSTGLGAPHFAEEGFDGANLPLAAGSPPLNASVGRADQGTQFVARFSQVPTGVQVFVTTRDVPGGLTSGNPDTPPAQAVLKTPAGTGGTTPGGVPLGSGGTTSGVAAGIPIALVSTPNGSGQAVWEWIGAPQPNQIQTLEFAVVLAMPQSAVLPAPITATVNLTLGPLSSVTTASETDPIPRFTDASKPQALFTVL